MVFFDREWPWKVKPGHMFSIAYISKSIQDNHRVTIGDG